MPMRVVTTISPTSSARSFIGIRQLDETKSRCTAGDRLGWIDRRNHRNLRCDGDLRFARSASGALAPRDCERVAGCARDTGRVGNGGAWSRPAFFHRVCGGGGLLRREPALADVAETAGIERFTLW